MEMTPTDVNNLDEVVHALGIEDSHITPAEAVKILQDKILDLQAALAGLAASAALNLVFDTQSDALPTMLDTEMISVFEQMHSLRKQAGNCSCDGCVARRWAADKIEQLRRNLDGRDAFIVSKGLWSEFVQQLPR